MYFERRAQPTRPLQTECSHWRGEPGDGGRPWRDGGRLLAGVTPFPARVPPCRKSPPEFRVRIARRPCQSRQRRADPGGDGGRPWTGGDLTDSGGELADDSGGDLVDDSGGLGGRCSLI